MEKTDETARAAILVRIRAMMAKTVANGCTEAEAQAAANMVDKLMALYEIDLTETLLQEQDVVKLDIKLDDHPVRWVAKTVAEFTDCKAWTESDRGFICFLGLEIDTQVAEYLMLLFQRAIDRETTSWAAFNGELALEDSLRRSQMVTSFSVGMASRLGERLMGLKSKRNFEQRKTGFDLVIAKGALVNEAFQSLGLSLGPTGKGMSIKHTGAYNAGRTAADGVAINQGVAGRSGGNGRIR